MTGNAVPVQISDVRISDEVSNQTKRDVSESLELQSGTRTQLASFSMPDIPTVTCDGEKIPRSLQITKWNAESWITMLQKAVDAARLAKERYIEERNQLQDLI